MDNTDLFLALNREIKDTSKDVGSIADRFFSGASPRLRKIIVSNFSRMRKSALDRRREKASGTNSNNH